MNKFRAYYAVWKLAVLVLITLFIFTDIDKDSLFYSIVISYFFALEHLIYSTIEDNEDGSELGRYFIFITKVPWSLTWNVVQTVSKYSRNFMKLPLVILITCGVVGGIFYNFNNTLLYLKLRNYKTLIDNQAI